MNYNGEDKLQVEMARINLENAKKNLCNAKENERLALRIFIITIALLAMSLWGLFRLFQS